jgi:hypothetical protein
MSTTPPISTLQAGDAVRAVSHKVWANIAMREFIIDLSCAKSFEDFVGAFNEGLCRHVGGGWEGRSWDAFHDYLSWPEEQSYRLTFQGWESPTALDPKDRHMIREILHDNPHVQVAFA